MSSFHPIKPLSRPTTPDRTSWFEFLLDASLLEKHLSEENPDPSAKELIGLFLHQADSALETAKDIARNAKTSDEIDDSDITVGPHKTKALRILALKVVAHLNWNLDVLEKGLPLGTVFEILNQLLRTTIPAEMDTIPHFQLDLTLLPAEALFALQLYYRWCVRTSVKDSFPEKVRKQISVNVPGLLDPLSNLTGTQETVIKAVSDSLDDSISMLTRIMSISRGVSMPTLASFRQLNENINNVIHDWSQNVPISADEVKCQVGYDLACLMFSQEKYEKAAELFNSTRDICKKRKNSLKFCCIEERRLEGYCMACSHLHPGTGKQKRLSPHKDGSLLTRLQHALNTENKKEILNILREDNRKLQMPYPMRTAVEESVTMAKFMNDADNLKVLSCTSVRRAQQGEPVPADAMCKLKKADQHILDYLKEVCGEGLRCGTQEQKSGVRTFIRYLCQVMPHDCGFVECFKQLLTDEEESKMTDLVRTEVPFVKNKNMATKETDHNLLQGELERELLQTYDPANIATLLTKITPQLHRKAIAEQFVISKEMSSSLDGVKSSHKETLCAHIYLAKSKTALYFKNYTKSLELCTISMNMMKEKSHKAFKVIRWEKLNIELCRYFDPLQKLEATQKQEIMNTVKAAMNSLQSEHDYPNLDIMSSCVAFLLSVEEFDYLAQLNVNHGLVGVGRLLSVMCKELHNLKAARMHAREFFEAVTLIYTNTTQQKRGHNGAALGNPTREGNMGLVSQAVFTQMICKITEPKALTTLISCLTKLYNVLQDNLHSEIYSEYLGMWPTAVVNSSSLNVNAVTDTVNLLMNAALSQHSKQLSWLRTKGDIHFANSEYNDALQYYLQLGVVATDYFHSPITKLVYDDALYRRMIRCSTTLQCHTQAAILCQCLDKPDYGIAFKSLQEQNSYDAMDSFYQYFWDVTMLEYLIHLHTERGELQRKDLAIQCIRQLDLNSSNPIEVLQEARKLRQAKFFCALVKQYM